MHNIINDVINYSTILVDAFFIISQFEKPGESGKDYPDFAKEAGNKAQKLGKIGARPVWP